MPRIFFQYSTFLKFGTAFVEKKYNKSDLVLDVETQKNAYPFSQFLAPFVRVAEDLLVDASKNNDFFCRNKKLILSEFENNLFTKLLDCSVRTLIFEMNLCREYNELEGSNPEEEYSFYCFQTQITLQTFHVFAHSTFSFFLDMPTLTKTRGKSKKNIRFFLLTILKNRVE